MRKWINTIIVSLLWVLNLINGTGLDSAYHVTDRVRLIVLFIAVASLILKMYSDHHMLVSHNDFLVFGGMFVVFLASSLLHGKGMQAFEYLYVFLVVFLLSELKLNELDFRSIGLVFGIAGFAILFIYERMSILSGWNENSIAMIGLFSYLVFLISCYSVKGKRSKILIVITAVIVSIFLNMTNSRSCILFIALAIAFAIGLINREILYRKVITTRIILLIPLLIAILVVGISKTDIVRRLDVWSLVRYKKAFFNGRDTLWALGFRWLSERPVLGNGNLLTYNWHNSAVTALTSYGVIGYLVWLGAFNNIFDQARRYLGDYLVQGCFVSFIIIYLQQSVELGLISAKPNLIPYTILGMMLGRINYLRSKKYAKF